MHRLVAFAWLVLTTLASVVLVRLATLPWEDARWGWGEPAALHWQAGPQEWGLTVVAGLLGVVSTVAVAFRMVKLRTGLTFALLTTTAYFAVGRASGSVLLPLDLWRSRAYAAVLSLALVACIVGLARRASWSRTLVLALGLFGLQAGARGVLGWFSWQLGYDDGSRLPAHLLTYVVTNFATWGQFAALWTRLLVTFASATLVLLVSGQSMREALGEVPRPDAPETAWRSGSGLTTTLRWTILTQCAAAVTSVLHVVRADDWYPAVPSAIPLAVLFAVAAKLSVARKPAGDLLLVLVSAGFLAQGVYLFKWGHREFELAALWVAAGLAGVASGVMLVRAARGK